MQPASKSVLIIFLLLALSACYPGTASAIKPTLTGTPRVPPGQTQAPMMVYDAKANAERVQFAPNTTSIDIQSMILANTSKRYVFSAKQGQVMSVAILAGPSCAVSVSGADGKSLTDPKAPRAFWRGGVPADQDYIVSVDSQVEGPFTLRVAIAPEGQSGQTFRSVNNSVPAGVSYPDDFAPTDITPPVHIKGTPWLTLEFIDPAFYSPKTNLIEAYIILAASKDPAVVATCVQPSTEVAEIVTGQVPVNNYTFTRSEFSGAAAGNRYDQTAFRTVVTNTCYELVLLVHSANIDNYPPGTVVEYDQVGLMDKFVALLDSFNIQ